MPNIRRVAGDQIIDGIDAMPFGQKSIHQMRTEKTRTAGHDRNGLGIFGGHLGFVSIGNHMNLPAGKSQGNHPPTLRLWRGKRMMNSKMTKE
jgi:hypothetical protein